MLVVLRLTIGWQFYQEGMKKYQDPNFSSAGFLMQAKGPLAENYHDLAGGDFHRWDELMARPVQSSEPTEEHVELLKAWEKAQRDKAEKAKADGTTIAGATEEHDSGFACHPTPEGRQVILEAALHLAPSLGEAEVATQVVGLRPCSADRLPLIGPVPDWPGVYMLAGHFRSGMLLSAMSTRIIAELIAHGKSPIPIDAFRPDRFGHLNQASTDSP